MKEQFEFEEIKVKEGDVFEVIRSLKSQGFSYFLFVTCVDWYPRDYFEVVYAFRNLNSGRNIKVKVRISRENPLLPSIAEEFPMAIYQERELAEMFGIKFLNHPDGEHLENMILEDWDYGPPMRKDFDSAEFSIRLFGERRYE